MKKGLKWEDETRRLLEPFGIKMLGKGYRGCVMLELADGEEIKVGSTTALFFLMDFLHKRIKTNGRIRHGSEAK